MPTVNNTVGSSSTEGTASSQANMIAATSVSGTGVQVSGSSANSGTQQNSAATTVAANVNATSGGGAQSAGAALSAGAKQQKMQQSVSMQDGISAKTLGKLKATFKEALHESHHKNS